MNQALTKLTAIGAIASLALVASCGGGSAELDDSPEAEAFLFRDAVMTIAEYKAGRIIAMHREEIPLDEEVFVESTRDLANVAGMLLDGFMTEGIVEPSRATPEIWENWEDFEQQARAFQEAAEMLADTAEQQGFEAARGLAQDTVGMCGDCHRPYRASEAE